MEDTVELKTKATPSTQNPNQDAAKDYSQIREQGKLSSYEDDAFPAGAASLLITSIAAPAEPVRVASVNKNTQLVKAGISISPNNPTSFVDVPSRTSVQPYHRKSSEKNRVPFVISFSDDDSSSESEESKQGKAFETKCNTTGMDGSRRPPVSSLAKSHMLRQTTGNNTKLIPRKVSLSRTFVSSMTKISGASSRNGGPSFVEQRSRVTNFNTLNKIKAGRERGHSQNVHLNSSKLQDLRQLIAIRENELKLKATQQNKETVAGSFKDYNVMNLSNDTARICQETSAEFLQFEPKEPEKKRLKVTEPHTSPLNSDGRQDMPGVDAVLASEKAVLECFDQQSVDDRSYRDKEITGANQWQKQEENRGIVSSANLPSGMNKGTGLVPDRTQCNSITKAAGLSVANRTARAFPQKLQTLELRHHSEPNRHQTPSSLPNCSVTNKAPRRRHSTRSSALQVRSGDKAVNPVSGDTYQACSLHVPDSNPETFYVSLNNASLRNSLDKANVSGTSSMDIQSLLDIEELQDKELEEAQEIRRKCEVEERNTLKAYRKAQRALFEAEARCSHIYRKRDLYATHFRSILMKDSSLLWSSRSHNQIGGGLNSLANMPEVNMNLLPSSSHQMQSEFDVQNQHGYDSDVRYAERANQTFSDQHKDVQNLASDVCSESDASTSDPLKDPGVDNVIRSLSNDSNTSEDEDEDLFSSDHKSDQSNLDGRRKEETYDDRINDLNEGSKAFASSQDSLLLEASLRSQLVTRLGIKNSLEKRGPIPSTDPAVERRIQNYDGGEETEKSMENVTFSEVVKDQHLDLGADPLDSCAVRSASFLGPTLRSAFGHMKISDAISLVQSQARNHQIHTSDIYDEESNGLNPNGSEPIIMSSNSTKEALMDICVSEGGSYTSNLAVDPFWPLCMYELRGKCNNDNCSWQHVRDYSCRNLSHENSDSGDCDVRSSPHNGNLYGGRKHSKSSDCLVMAPPTYLVCLDILQADNHPYKSIVAQSVGKCWRKRFSASLVLSCLLSTDLPYDEPYLRGTEASIEVHGGWNRQSSYFHSREGALGPLEKHLADNDQSLEMALLNLNQEVNKHKGRIESLKVLARALEADPSCVVLWIVYLHIYYSNQKSIGKDDMFHCAVEHNKGSYELWLMYINSRLQLNDCLAACDTALSALCAHASASDRDATHASECILDLFLQMMNCLCVSGKVGAAILKIYGLYTSSKKSDDPHCPLLPDIITHLTVYDKCILWVSCVYLVIYKKLPDDIVRCFECNKELSAIEWPSTNLTVKEKQQAVTLMEMAVDSLALYIDCETTLKAAHVFALNHIRCIAVLEGLECSRNLLEKYVKLYPSCLELVLMAARAEHDFGDLSFLGFEEALRRWLEEVPGAQCIWNQYAECALQNGRLDFAKELMDRWFHSVWKVQCSQSENLDIFGLLNLSLLKMLQDDRNEARLAIERALKAASAEDYKQCVMEHAVFFGSQLKVDAWTSGILNILNSYLVDTRAFPVSEPLSRKFIQSIKKPRARQLVSNLLTPLSSDFSLMNSVLKAWHGPCLLPQASSIKLVNLVELVEAIMEICPANYPLAISLCKLLAGPPGSGDVSGSVSFWASSLLVNALFQAVPIAPEYVWVEAAGVLQNLTGTQSLSESFHKRALSIYPFSLKLWESYLNLSRITGNIKAIIEGAKERGIKLG